MEGKRETETQREREERKGKVDIGRYVKRFREQKE